MANNNSVAFSGKIDCTKSILGKGGFGIVYRGRYEDCDVAVKKIQLDSFEGDDREIRIQNGLDHENVLKILTVEDNDDFRFIVLELCAGTLQHVCCQMYQGPDLPPDDQVLYQIANGLEYIHSKKFVHRDIKPENILISLTTPVRMKLSDFGLSKEISTMNTCSMSGFKGTKLWMAPELLKMQDPNSIKLKLTYSTSSDIFSTGCVFFFFITRGTHLFGDVNYVLPNILNNERKNLDILLNQNHFASDIVRGMTLDEPKSRLTIQNVLDLLRLETGQSETEIKIAPKAISESVQFVLRTRQCKNMKETDNLVIKYRFHPVHPILAVGLKTGRLFLIESESHDDSFPNWKTETELHSSTSATLYSLDWNVDGTLLAAGYSNKTVIVWRYPGGHVIFRGVDQSMRGVEKIFWSPFMSELFVFCTHHQQGPNKEGIISSWLSSEQRVRAQTFTINCYIWDIVWLSFSSFAAGCDDGIIRVYQLKKNKSLVMELHHGGKIRNLAYNQALELLASCSYEGTVKVWSIGDHTPITKLDVNSQCHCLCWHPLSNWQTNKSSSNYSIACGLKNGSIILWDHLNVEKTMTLKSKHNSRIRDVSYSPDGRFLASVGNDDQIIIWSSKDWSTIGWFDMKNCLLLERKILWNSTSQKLTISSRRCQIPMIEYVK